MNYLYLVFKISIIQQKYEHITKNIYFIQEKSVNINTGFILLQAFKKLSLFMTILAKKIMTFL